MLCYIEMVRGTGIFCIWFTPAAKKYNSETENIEIDSHSFDKIQQCYVNWLRQTPLV
jgi:hypothetical protein